MARTISAAIFKNQCLRLMDRVQDSGQELLVTKRGRPVVRVVPAAAPERDRDLEGMIIHQDADLFSTGETWEADQ